LGRKHPAYDSYVPGTLCRGRTEMKAVLDMLLRLDNAMFKHLYKCCYSPHRIGFLGVLSAFMMLILAPLLHGNMRTKSLVFRDNFDSGTLNDWQMPYPEDWQIIAENGLHYLHMVRSRPPGVPRRPLQFALLKRIRAGSLDLEVRVRRRTGHSMLVVFNYVDTLHFYYAHLSKDRGTTVPVHNGIFIVNGVPRRRIAGTNASPALPDLSWHTVRIVRDARSGSIKVFVDGQSHPLFSAVDHTFTCGEIGFGSFDETGDFAHLRVRSKDVGCADGGESKKGL
jgi:hypothetical protein